MAKVLVVDDEAGFREQLHLCLSRDGHEVFCAADGQTAIDLGSRYRPDVLVVDWMLQDSIHGLHVMEVLRAVRPELQCILITGFASKDLQAKANKMFIFDFFEKPFDLDFLKHAVQHAAEKPLPPSRVRQLAAIETTSSGEISYASPDAAALFAETSAGPSPRRIQDVFAPEDAERLECADRRWVELRPLGLEDRVWFLRSRGWHDSTNKLYVLLPESERPQHTYAVVNMLLGLAQHPIAHVHLDGHVLLVQPNKIERRLTVDMLERLGAVYHAADESDSALRLFQSDDNIRYAIINCDDTEGQGRALLERLRTQQPSLVLVALCSEPCHESTLVGSGASNVLVKPWIMHDLAAALSQPCL